MTGKDLIIYILVNDLVNKDISKVIPQLKTITVEEAAVKYDVGPATIQSAFEMGLIEGIKMNDVIYIFDTPEEKKC